MQWRALLKGVTPPFLAGVARRLLGRGLRFEGVYASWAEAQRASAGFDTGEIVRRVLDAELKVKRGEAADARDGVTFTEPQYPFAVMAALARARALHGEPLRVLDLGGALGGTYRQHKSLFPGTRTAWTVVEQPTFVALGKKHFEGGELKFKASLDEAIANASAHVAVLSSVLQYLPDPMAAVGRIAAANVQSIVIDRTPCSALAHDVLTVQKVPAEIYRASYPCWIFSRQRLLQALAPRYSVLCSFADGSGEWRTDATPFQLAGFILERRS
jgi:putative methyltransferase (TIGR04325 family)